MITDIYTDGSLGKGTIGGLGYLIIHREPEFFITAGFEDKKVTRIFRDSLYLELLAIQQAIKAAVDSGDDLYGADVWTDSRDAVGMVTDNLYRVTLQTHYGPVLQFIRRELAANHLTLRHMKGHSRDPYNDGADRLAVLARRNKEFGLPRNHGHGMAAAIVDELMAAYKLHRHDGHPDNIRLHRAAGEELCPECRQGLRALVAEAS